MAYEKHTWTTGEVITAGKLNNMEDGIASANGAFISATQSDTTVTLNKTYAEIVNAVQNGALPFLAIEDPEYPGSYNINLMGGYGSGEVDGIFSCHVHFMNDDYSYDCLTENDYPARTINIG